MIYDIHTNMLQECKTRRSPQYIFGHFFNMYIYGRLDAIDYLDLGLVITSINIPTICGAMIENP